MLRTRSVEPRTPASQQTEDHPTTPETLPPAPSRGAGLRARWRALPDGLRWSLLVYLLSRVPILLGLMAFWFRNRHDNVRTTALRQDGWWYVRLAEQGYSTALHAPVTRLADYHHDYSDWAFFPGYPLIVRFVHYVTFLPYLYAAILAAAVLGLVAVWAVYTLGASFGGAPVGRASALLVAAWPGSAAFTLPYSEGLFVTVTALALVCIHRERWVLAGLLGAVATATRPTGLALVAAAAVVAVVRLGRYREVRPVLTPVLSLGGVAAFVLYGWYRTGDLNVWRHAENLWNQRLDLSRTLLKKTAAVFADPAGAMHTSAGRLQLANSLLDVVGALLLLAMVVAVVVLRRRVTLAWLVYALVAGGMIVAYSAVAPRPRTVLALLPGFVWLAAWLPRRVLYGLCGFFLVAMPFVVYLWSWRVTP